MHHSESFLTLETVVPVHKLHAFTQIYHRLYIFTVLKTSRLVFALSLPLITADKPALDSLLLDF